LLVESSDFNPIEKILNNLNTSVEFKISLQNLVTQLDDPDESTVLLLRLGFMKNQIFNEKQISEILGKEEQEIDSIILRGLSKIGEMSNCSQYEAKNIVKDEKQIKSR